MDPLYAKYPWNSNYAFSENRLLDAVELEGLEARLIITDQIVGYTPSFIYGDGRAIVVPVYSALLVDAQNPTKTIAYCGVTRDGWYGLGPKDPNDPTKGTDLMNRTFEPCEQDKLYSTSENSDYSGPGVAGYYLSDGGTDGLCAEPQPTQYRNDGSKIEGARNMPDRAGGVMFHIGGWYKRVFNNGASKEKLAGSEGCFAFIPQNQIYSKESHAQGMIDNGVLGKHGTSNKAWREFREKIREVRKATKGTKRFEILIKKRESYEKTKTI